MGQDSLREVGKIAQVFDTGVDLVLYAGKGTQQYLGKKLPYDPAIRVACPQQCDRRNDGVQQLVQIRFGSLVTDDLISDPRQCKYWASKDTSITRASCAANDATCLTPGEAKAIDSMWKGPVACKKGSDCNVPDVASRKLDGGKSNQRLWYGQPRGTDLGSLGGVTPFAVVQEQNRYWVYFDPTWDWKSVKPQGFAQYFKDNVDKVGPMMASDNPDLSAFRRQGGKVILWHGWADPLINAMGSIDYYERVTSKMGGTKKTQEFARLFMAPGIGHCGGGPGFAPTAAFDAVVNWVEKGIAPATLPSSRVIQGKTQTRPLCPYPSVAKWNGKGPDDDASSYSCAAPKK